MTADIAYAFQEAIVHMLGKKLLQAVQEFDAHTV
jgi:tRNA A37 threonylcarbamoyltransferase TsaD